MDLTPASGPPAGDRPVDALRQQIEDQAAELRVQARRLDLLEQEQAAAAARLRALHHRIYRRVSEKLSALLLSAGLLRRRAAGDAETEALVTEIEGYAREAQAEVEPLLDLVV